MFLPFLLGGALASLAEPGVRFCQKNLHWNRKVASVACLGVSLVLLASFVAVAAAALYRQAGAVAKQLPGVLDSAQKGLHQVEVYLLRSAQDIPSGMQSVVRSSVERMFSSGSQVLERLAQSVLCLAGQIISGIPNGALFVGTLVLSAFLISSQRPQLLNTWHRLAPPAWHTTWKPALQRLRTAMGGWLRAQLLLMLLTYAILALGLTLLRIPRGYLWALPIALLDALPMIGTGIALGPWAVVLLTQGRIAQAIGMGALFVVATLSRSMAEPRLLGKELGLHPLATLVAMYAGFQVWGILGMILSPVLAVTVKQTLDCISLEPGV